ncbi:tetratricopeptide repeat [Bacteroidales bacterium 6E]|nr:tetratricopeptide repeat [Bacteroidales bacterium 6E]
MSAQKKHQDAFEAFDRATALDPSRPDVWGMKASALAGAGKYDEAIAAISKAIEMVPGHPVAIYNRACIYCLKGDRENALADLKKAVSIDAKLKETAKQDADFTTLYNDEEFKKLTAATE